MKLLIAGAEPPNDIMSWSGIPYHLSRVDEVYRLSRDAGAYRAMASRARRDYEERLNWDVYARSFKDPIAPASSSRQPSGDTRG